VSASGTRAIVFDLDGTLADTAADILFALNGALDELGFPAVSMEQALPGIGPGTEVLCQLALPDGEVHRADDFLAVYRAHYLTRPVAETALYPGVMQLLDQLGAYRLAVASNKLVTVTDQVLDGLGIHDYFACVVGPEDVERPKPDGEMLELAMTRLGVEPARTLMVGDSKNDFMAARSAGIRCCAVTYGYGSAMELASFEPDVTITSPLELLAVLDDDHVGLTRRDHNARVD
jgi:phosphoglycolate phosphatase